MVRFNVGCRVEETHEFVDAEGADEPGNRRGHAVPRVGLEVVAARAREEPRLDDRRAAAERWANHVIPTFFDRNLST